MTEDIQRACEVMRAGGIILYPTDTIWGIGCDATNEEAIRRVYELNEDGSVVQKKYVDVKFTLDERIADGFYYAAFLKHYKRILQHPEILNHPPEEVLNDID